MRSIATGRFESLRSIATGRFESLLAKMFFFSATKGCLDLKREVRRRPHPRRTKRRQAQCPRLATLGRQRQRGTICELVQHDQLLAVAQQ